GHVYLSPRQICATLPFLGLTCLPLPEFAMATLDLRGDDTVPVHSAMGINLRADDERYYFAPNMHHGSLPNDSYVQSMVAQMARGELCSYKDQPPPPRADRTAAATASSGLPLRVSGTEILVVGTADLHIYDSTGRHTGPITQTYAIETDIPEIGYDTANGGVIAMLPETGSYTLVLEGRSPAGAAQLRISAMQEGEVTQALVYETVPITVTTAATLTLALPGLPVGTTLAFQYQEGDAVQQVGTLPLLTGPASRDLVPPTSVIQIGEDGKVTITAEDNADGAGVDKILYSVKGSIGPFSVYTGPFLLPDGTKEIVAVALDRAGNAEYPGAKLSLGPANQIFLPVVRK
ncbi:MAG: hypothetical protein KF893_22970, partial [Caldilineaceae bacterium]|nr:hypothetical protein [Caldilineaceae bacterium]